MPASTCLPSLGHRFRSAARAAVFSSCAFLLLSFAPAVRAEAPAVGEKAPDFTLNTLAGKSVRLSTVSSAGHTVLVVLRGWPGYQCPFCTVQVYEYMAHAAEFAAKHVQVVLIYPGPSEALQAHAEEFLKDKPLPENVTFLIDPNYDFANEYSLRWAEKNETVYPSTFILDHDGIVRFAHVSREHGDRISAAAVLRFLETR